MSCAELLALAEWQFVESIGLDHVGQIEVGAGAVELGIVGIEKILKSRLRIAVGVAQYFRKRIIRFQA